MTERWTRQAGGLLAAIALAGCLGAGEERARLDEEVGRGEAAGVRFEVEEGLAAIRSLAPGRIDLWAQAPRLTIRVAATADAASEPWALTLANAMPDAALTLRSGDGAPVVVPPDGPTRGTRRRWTVPLPAATSAVLTIAPPASDEHRPFRFAVVSDVQDARARFGDFCLAMNGDPTLRFVASTGDLTESGDDAQLVAFLDELEDLAVPFFSTIGNHDVGAGDPQLWHERLGRHSFRFGFQGVAFSFVDSAGASVDPLVYRWLDGWLAAARNQVHIVLTHVPPLEPSGLRNGSFGSRAEAGKLLRRLAGGATDLAIHGHVHSFDRFESAGIPSVISGGGGAIPEAFDEIGRHYLVVDVDPSTGVTRVEPVRLD